MKHRKLRRGGWRSRGAGAERRVGVRGSREPPPLPGLLFLSCRLPKRLSKGSHSSASPSLLNPEPRALPGPRTETHDNRVLSPTTIARLGTRRPSGDLGFRSVGARFQSQARCQQAPCTLLIPPPLWRAYLPRAAGRSSAEASSRLGQVAAIVGGLRRRGHALSASARRRRAVATPTCPSFSGGGLPFLD